MHVLIAQIKMFVLLFRTVHRDFELEHSTKSQVQYDSSRGSFWTGSYGLVYDLLCAKKLVLRPSHNRFTCTQRAHNPVGEVEIR